MQKHAMWTAGLVIVWLVVGCGDDSSVNPIAESEPGYELWVSAVDPSPGSDSARFLVIDIPADTLVRSFNLPPYAFTSFQFTPDGGSLLLHGNQDGTVVLDATDLTLQTTLDHFGPFFFDENLNAAVVDNGQWVVRYSLTSLEPIDSTSLPATFTGGDLHQPSHKFYIATGGPVVYILDLAAMSISDSIRVVVDNVDRSVDRLVAVPEHDRLGCVGDEGIFVYDYGNHTVVAQQSASRMYASVIRTPDGSRVMACDPGRVFTGQPPTLGFLWSYGILDGQIDTFETIINDSLGQRTLDAKAMWVTPDGEHLITVGSLIPGMIRWNLDSGEVHYPFADLSPWQPHWAGVVTAIN